MGSSLQNVLSIIALRMESRATMLSATALSVLGTLSRTTGYNPAGHTLRDGTAKHIAMPATNINSASLRILFSAQK